MALPQCSTNLRPVISTQFREQLYVTLRPFFTSEEKDTLSERAFEQIWRQLEASPKQSFSPPLISNRRRKRRLQHVSSLYHQAYLCDLQASLFEAFYTAFNAASLCQKDQSLTAVRDTIQCLSKQVAFEALTEKYTDLRKRFHRLYKKVKEVNAGRQHHAVGDLLHDFTKLTQEHDGIERELKRALTPEDGVDLHVPIETAKSLIEKVDILGETEAQLAALSQAAAQNQVFAEWLQTEIAAVRALSFDKQSIIQASIKQKKAQQKTPLDQAWCDAVNALCRVTECKPPSLDEITKQTSLVNQCLMQRESDIAKLLLNDLAFAHRITNAGQLADAAASADFGNFIDTYFEREMCRETPKAEAQPVAKQHARSTTASRLLEMSHLSHELQQHFTTSEYWQHSLGSHKAFYRKGLEKTHHGIKNLRQRLEEIASESGLKPRLPAVVAPATGGAVSALVSVPMLLVAITALASNPVGWAVGLLVAGVAALVTAAYLFYQVFNNIKTIADLQAHGKSPALQAQLVEQEERLPHDVPSTQRKLLRSNGILVHSLFPEKFRRRGCSIVPTTEKVQPCSMMTGVMVKKRDRYASCDVSRVPMILTNAVMFPPISRGGAPVPLPPGRREIAQQLLQRRARIVR